MLAASGTVKDNFLILGQRRKLCPELGERDGPFQLHAPELIIAVIGANEKNLTYAQLLEGFLWSYAVHLGHKSLLIYPVSEESGSG
jgi:hypothetical protein